MSTTHESRRSQLREDAHASATRSHEPLVKMHPPDYRFEVYDSIRRADLDEWNSLRKAASDPFMDPRFIAAAEKTFANVCRFRHVLVRNNQHVPMATACLCSYGLGGDPLATVPLQKVLAVLDSVVPRLTRLKSILCSLPISAGQSHVRFSPRADRPAALRCLDQAACEFASEEGARLILFKEIDPPGCVDLGPLAALGYRRADSFPMNEVEPGFRDFEDYLSRFTSKKRWVIHRSQRKFKASGLRLVRLFGRNGIPELYTDRVHALYRAVAERSAVQIDDLPADFPRELARQMPDNTVFTLVDRGADIVGFSMALVSDTSFHGVVLGVDYAVNAGAEVYFNLLYDSIDFAFQRGARKICLGQTTDALKHDKLGCFQVPLSVYVKACHWDARAILKAGFSWFFPPRPLLYPSTR
jgi:predicted N-acyltransferase